MRRIGSAIALISIALIAATACTPAQPVTTPFPTPTAVVTREPQTVAPQASPTDAPTAAPETAAPETIPPSPTSGPITEPPTTEAPSGPTEPSTAPPLATTEPGTGEATGAPPSFVIPSFPVVSFPPFTTGEPCPITAQLPRRVLGGQVVYITLSGAQLEAAFVERLEQAGIPIENVCYVAGTNPADATFGILAYQAQGASSTQLLTAFAAAGATPVRLGDRVVLQMECPVCPTEGMSTYAYAIEDALIAFNATADDADDIAAALP
jgi:hypothetical protein